MKTNVLVILIALALFVVPVAAEEENWSYTITSGLQTVAEGLTFGCNTEATDDIDLRYDMPAPPAPMGRSGYAAYQLYTSEGVLGEDIFVQALNAPLTTDHRESVFYLKLSPDTTNPTEPFSISWDPYSNANIPGTVTAITLTNLSDTSDAYNLLEAGSAYGTGFVTTNGIVTVVPRTYAITVTGPHGPSPAFRANVTSGVAPLTVGFTDLSPGSPATWDWSFGDGDTSSGQNPVHQYLSPGNYTVSLAADGCEDCCTRVDYIKVTPVLFGDANDDDLVNQVDTLRVLKEVVGLTAKPVSADILTKTDVHANGVVDVGDAMFIAQFNAGLRGPWFELIG